MRQAYRVGARKPTGFRADCVVVARVPANGAADTSVGCLAEALLTFRRPRHRAWDPWSQPMEIKHECWWPRKSEESGGRPRLFPFNYYFPEDTATVGNLDLDGFALACGFHFATNCDRSPHEAPVGQASSLSGDGWLKSVCSFSRRFPCHLETTSVHHNIPKEVLNERPTVRGGVRATCNGERKRDSANNAKFHRPHPMYQPRRALRSEDR